MNVIERTTEQLPRPSDDLERHDFRCEGCGYGAVACIAPARSPMCGSSVWRLTAHAGPDRQILDAAAAALLGGEGLEERRERAEDPQRDQHGRRNQYRP